VSTWFSLEMGVGGKLESVPSFVFHLIRLTSIDHMVFNGVTAPGTNIVQKITSEMGL
jgi:hypothetical protein